MDIFDQEKFDMLMDLAAFGGLSPYDQSVSGGMPKLFTFPDEVITWVANVDVDSSMWGTKSGSIDVYLGVSPYRLVFCREEIRIIGANKVYCKSYWFDLDFEGWKWRKKKRRNHTLVKDLSMDKPQLKKGIVSRTLRIKYLLTQDNGKTRDFFGSFSNECEISSIKWIDPATGKKVGRNAEQVYEQILQAYNNQLPVKATELVLLFEGPEILEEYLYLTQEPEEIEGQIINHPDVQPEHTPLPNKPAREKQPTPDAKVRVCESCESSVQTRWKVCPACGEPLPKNCIACGQVLQLDWKTCPHCGTTPVGR